MKRSFALLLISFFVVVNQVAAYACNEYQSNTYVTEILFGDRALSYASDDNLKILQSASYLCSEQSDGKGQDKIDYLKGENVKGIPVLDDIDIGNGELIECSHVCWEFDYPANNKARSSRRKLLQKTVNSVFDFGVINNLFNREKGKCNSFAALVYYSHILADYIADNPEESETWLKGKEIPSYCGEAYISINGGRPSFSVSQKRMTEAYTSFSQLDGYGRSGVAYAVIGQEIMPPPNSRQIIGMIKPSGWNQKKYPGIINPDPAYLFNRCHLIAHELAGNDDENNLITGTRYLNEEMMSFEGKVASYIRNTNNHVLYRATPNYDKDNKIASGVQLEAYSVEDEGKGICFNTYFYNVQPGIEINYASGNNELADTISFSEKAIPFAINNPSNDNPDLIYEVNKHLGVLFEDQKDSGNFIALTNEINSISNEARSLGRVDEKPAQTYMKMKACEYKYFQALKTYIPLLLTNESFFRSGFK